LSSARFEILSPYRAEVFRLLPHQEKAPDFHRFLRAANIHNQSGRQGLKLAERAQHFFALAVGKQGGCQIHRRDGFIIIEILRVKKSDDCSSSGTIALKSFCITGRGIMQVQRFFRRFRFYLFFARRANFQADCAPYGIAAL
jgi:hypothetical protein